MSIHHLGLATNDIAATRAFYEGILGFLVAADDYIEIAEGGRIRHIMFDFGGGSLIAFMANEGVGAIRDFDANVNRGLGTPRGFYHFAFDAGSVANLEAKHKLLLHHGVAVSDIATYEWAKSIYFGDPNGLMLEYCAYTRPLTPDDAVLRVRYHDSVANFVYGDIEDGSHEDTREEQV